MALSALASPRRGAEQLGWVRRARALSDRDLRREIRHFRFFLAGSPELFPSILPFGGEVEFADDVATLRRSRRKYADSVLIRLSGKRLVDRKEIVAFREPAWYRAAATTYAAAHPHSAAMLAEFRSCAAESLERFATMLQRFHDEVMRPLFGPIDARLRADVAMRREMLHAHGAPATLRTLAPALEVARRGGGEAAIRIGDDGGVHVLSEDATVMLMPSFFSSVDVQAFILRRTTALECGIVYRLPAIPERRIASDGARAGELLSALAEPSRLQLVRLLARGELSTRELASFLHTSEPVVSRHLRILADAGAVERRRQSYFVLYRLRRDAFRDLREMFASLLA